MADKDEAGEVKKSSGGGGGLLQIIIIVLLVLVLAVAGFIAWKMIEMDKKPVDPAVAEASHNPDVAMPEGDYDNPETPPVFIDLDNITVNLADADSNRFLRAKIKLEVRGDEAKAKVTENMVKINDLLITVLASKRLDEIRTPQGKYALKEDLIYRMNRLVSGKPIKNLYFEDFVSQ